MNAPMPFANGEFALELIPDGDSFKVVASGLARSLGFREAFDLVRSIPDAEKGSELVRTPGGEQRVLVVTEAGFYRALGQRQAARVPDLRVRESVERFQAWVYGDVLPALRRASVPVQRELTRLELIDLAREAELGRIEAENRATAAEHQVLELMPAARAFDTFLAASKSNRNLGQVAKLLSWRECDLRQFLLAEGLVFVRRRPCDGRNEYHYMASNKPHFSHKETLVHHSGFSHNHFTLYITPRGMDLIRKRLAARRPQQQMTIEAAS